MDFRIECEREDDGRWLAEVPQLPGVLAYGSSADEAMAKAEALALRVLAERLEHGESRAHHQYCHRRGVSPWPSTKARRVFAALLARGWRLKRQSGSHRTLTREGWPDFVFAFHDGDEIGPKMLSRIAKHTGLDPGDL